MIRPLCTKVYEGRFYIRCEMTPNSVGGVSDRHRRKNVPRHIFY